MTNRFTLSSPGRSKLNHASIPHSLINWKTSSQESTSESSPFSPENLELPRQKRVVTHFYIRLIEKVALLLYSTSLMISSNFISLKKR
jgi:hypothetical protein